MVLNKIFNIILVAILVAVVVQRVSLWRKSSAQKGTSVEDLQVNILNPDGSIHPEQLVVPNKKKVLIFWATWCGPCRLELARVQKLIQNKEVSPKDILVVSSYEEKDVILKTAQKREYTFPLAIDHEGILANKFDVVATPMTIFIDQGQVVDVSTGISLLIERTLRHFLNETSPVAGGSQ
ncbi:MAG: TlpA family protein disulfide reductase [Bdellovibrionaceae bacterium]|nr:TlpA family protein disulfide reductase [Pseudobdellovibrionaceae bacterium]